jgi:hypothetical protein
VSAEFGAARSMAESLAFAKTDALKCRPRGVTLRPLSGAGQREIKLVPQIRRLRRHDFCAQHRLHDGFFNST